MFRYPGFQFLIESVVEKNRPIASRDLLLGKDNPKTKTSRAAPILHALTNIQKMNLLNRICVVRNDLVQTVLHGGILLTLRRHNESHRIAMDRDELSIEEIG